MPEANPLIPSWLALIVGSLTLVLIASHLLALNHATDIDGRRRRIRMTNAVLMMLVVPFITYGFGMASPSRGRPYVYTWVVTASLLIIIILVALVDMLHSWQLNRIQMREVRRQLAISRGLEARAASILASPRPTGPTRNPAMPGDNGARRPPLRGLLGRGAARIYGLAIARINRRFDRGKAVVRFDRPVISVGNLSVGGTGKTPMVRHIVRTLLAAGHTPCIAMRGYKGGPGSDEAAAYARELPGIHIVAQANRTEGLLQLFSHEHDTDAPPSDCIILDDGFQHRQIARDLDIVLIDATRPPFDDRLLPAGWLREPVLSLNRAGLVIITHAESADAADIAELDRDVASTHGGRGADAITRHAWTGLSVSENGLDSDRPSTWLRGRRIFAACAIGNPAPFLDMATKATGSPLAGTLILPDHDPFSPSTILRLIDESRAASADTILITDKDWSKLRAVAPAQWPCPIARPHLNLFLDRSKDSLREALLKTIAQGAAA